MAAKIVFPVERTAWKNETRAGQIA